MSEQRIDPTFDYLGYHLGLIDGQQRTQIEGSVSQLELTTTCRKLDSLLQPLSTDNYTCSSNLCTDIMQRLDSLHTTYKLPTTTKIAPAADAPVPVGGGGFSLRELLSLAAAIAIFVGVFVPGYNHARLASQRTLCQNNMRLIGAGLGGYAHDNDGQMPYVAGMPIDGVWAPTSSATPGYRYVSNSGNLFPLVTQKYVNPSVFVHRAGDTAMSLKQVSTANNFAPRNNSYSVHFIDQPQRQSSFDPNAPLISDLTPLFDDNRQLVNGPIPVNSTSHGALNGQNVLRGNQSVIWTNTPNVGLGNDDIYRLIGVDKYTGHERPSNRTDAFLIP
jgi:hypothetical protein